jgi:hypothetical protein
VAKEDWDFPGMNLLFGEAMLKDILVPEVCPRAARPQHPGHPRPRAPRRSVWSKRAGLQRGLWVFWRGAGVGRVIREKAIWGGTAYSREGDLGGDCAGLGAVTCKPDRLWSAPWIHAAWHLACYGVEAQAGRMLTRPDAVLLVQWQESQELDNWGNPLPNASQATIE